MTQTIQATGKLWKLVQLCGTLGILTAAAIWFSMLFADVGPMASNVAVMAVVAAVPCYVVGRFGAWWFHG